MAKREDVIKLVKTPNGGAIGAELGVATGQFSARLLAAGDIYLFSIDMWEGDRGHDIDQYKQAVRALQPFKERSTILRMRFSEALDLFPDEYFDFLYIDGYAHTGQENGETLRDWYPKLKPGGIFSGDDYDPKWPGVVTMVDEFTREHGLELTVYSYTPDNPWDGYPNWWLRKP